MRRDTDGLLSRGRIRHQQDFLRLQKFFELLYFLDQRRVDLLPSRCVENLDVAALLRRPIETRRRGTQHIFFREVRRVNRHLHLTAQRGELLDRRGPLQVTRDQQRRAPLFL